MKIRCQSCNKKISIELTDGICSKCGSFNRYGKHEMSMKVDQNIAKPVTEKETVPSSQPVQKNKSQTRKKLRFCISIMSILIVTGKPIINYIIHVSERNMTKDENPYNPPITQNQIEQGEVIIVDNIVVDYIPYENNPNYEQNIIIPEGVVEIGEKAFYNVSGANEIIFPSTLKKVSKRAFYGCNNVKESRLPEGLEIVEDYAFEGIRWSFDELPTSLKEIGVHSFASVYIASQEELPPNAKFTSTSFDFYPYESSDDMVIAGTNLLCYQGNEKVVEIPQGITEIGESAFKNNETLESVIIPEGVTNIGEYAFGNTTLLSEIILPTSLMTIQDGAFYYCEELSEITFQDNQSSLKKIGNYAFWGCNKLKSFQMPESVIFLGAESFGESMWYSDKEYEYGEFYGMLGNKILVGSPNEFADIVEIPSGILHIGSRSLDCYEENDAPSKIIFPKGILTIQDYAINIAEEKTIILDIPNSVEYIGELTNKFEDTTYIIMCEENSYAYTYAKQNHLEIQIK